MQSKQSNIKYEIKRLVKNGFAKAFEEAYFDNPPKDYKVISQYLVKLKNEILKKIEKDFADEN